MLAYSIKVPEDYLGFSKKIVKDACIHKSYPKINRFYTKLCEQFEEIFNDHEKNLFLRMGELLDIDAQIQILIELIDFAQRYCENSFQMSEEEVIHMVQCDKKYFYRELTGGNHKKKPKLGLLYLSDDYGVV